MKTEGMYDPLKVLVFHNITKDVFEGKWNGRIRVFQPDEKATLTEYLAEHYCKQLIDAIVGKEFDAAGKNPAKIKHAYTYFSYGRHRTLNQFNSVTLFFSNFHFTE